MKRVPWLRGDAAGRPALLVQLLIIGVFLGFYDVIRDLAPGRIGLAVSNARHLLDAEKVLHVDFERWANHWLAGHDTIGYVAGTLYDSLHYLITMPLLFLVYARFPRHYRRLRDILIVVNVIGMFVFWAVPMAPPRLTTGLGPGHGYADIVADTGALGGAAKTIASQADQYAAMPSLHVGWAIWVTLVVFAVTRDPRWRALGVAYPVATVLIIVSTGNHWVLDAVAGAVCLALSVLLVDVVLQMARRGKDHRPAEDLTPVG